MVEMSEIRAYRDAAKYRSLEAYHNRKHTELVHQERKRKQYNTEVLLGGVVLFLALCAFSNRK